MIFPEVRQAVLGELDALLPNGYDLVFVPARSDAHQDQETVNSEATRAFKHTTVLGNGLPMNTIAESALSCYAD